MSELPLSPFPPPSGLTMVGADDAGACVDGACVDGVCAVPGSPGDGATTEPDRED